MKRTHAIPAAIVLGLAACNDMSRPITSGDFDPLSPPGGQTTPVAHTPAISAGQFVRAIMDNTAFFKARPKGEADADKLLARGTSMKVVSSSDTYLKVELDSGEIGWVPMVMVEDPNAAAAQDESFGAPNPGEYQVYPPVGGYGGMLPPTTPAELPPEGAIPTVIDPEAPINPDPIPPVTVPGDEFPADPPIGEGQELPAPPPSPEGQ